jgi:Zn-dependent protease/CBS domain-containing protein
MFGRRITLFKLFGFEVRVDASWIVIALLVTWSLAMGLFPATYPGLPASSYWWMGFMGALGLFGSIVVHELSHSLVANHYKLPMKGITLFIFGGVAEMGDEPQSPKVEFLMAIAGPLASVVIGAVFYGVWWAGRGSWIDEVSGILAYLAWINLLLAVFNMIPAFPLDGGRVLRSALWHFKGDLRRATRVASLIGSGFGILLMAYAVFRLFFGDFISAVWYFMIGMFLRNASRVSYEQLVLREALQGEPIRKLMKPDPVTVPPEITLRQLVDEYLYRYHFRMFPVVTDTGHLMGCVGARELREIPREEWDRHTVGEIAKPSTDSNTVDPDADALKALSKMRDVGTTGLMVTDRDHLLAIVSMKDLLKLLAMKVDLEGGEDGVPDMFGPHSRN